MATKLTAVVSNAVLASETNFSQGFDVYRETWMDASRGKEHSRADHVTDLALEVLKEVPARKVHVMDSLRRSALSIQTSRSL